MEKPVILCYGTAEGTEKQLEKAGAPLGVAVRHIALTEYGLPIAAAISGRLSASPLAAQVPLSEPVLVFANFPAVMLDVFLSSLREKQIGKGILKAVLTPHNAAWTPAVLLGELQKEREALRRK